MATTEPSTSFSESDLNDLISFLNSDNAHLRQVTSKVILDLSGGNFLELLLHSSSSSSSSSSNFQTETPFLPKLLFSLKTLLLDETLIALNAIQTLVNFTKYSEVFSYLEDTDFLTLIIQLILSPTSMLADPACMLLSNLTHHPPIAIALLSMPSQSFIVSSTLPINGDKRSTFQLQRLRTITTCTSAMHQLVEVFGSMMASANELTSRGYNLDADYHFLASVFANLSQLKESHSFFLNLPSTLTTTTTTNDLSTSSVPKDYISPPLTSLLCFLNHPNFIRRSGMVSVLKNLAFHVPYHAWFLDLTHPLSVVIPILHRLTPSTFWSLEKKEDDQDSLDEELLDHVLYPYPLNFEVDPKLQLTLLETLFLFTATRASREALRKAGSYLVLREYHKQCQVDKCSELVEKVVNHLMRGEEEEGKEKEKESSTFMETMMDEKTRSEEDHEMIALSH